MGRDKAKIEINGNTLLDRAVAQLQGVIGNSNHVWVSGNRDGYNSVPDLVEGLGPIGGLAAITDRILKEYGPSWAGKILIVPVDMPRVSSEMLGKLIDEPSDGVVQLSNTELPACILFSERFQGVLKDLMQKTVPSWKRSVRALLLNMGAKQIDVKNIHELENWNYPEDVKDEY